MHQNVKITAGDGGEVHSVRLPNGQELLREPVPFHCSHADTAMAVARAINSSGKRRARAVGNRVVIVERRAFIRFVLAIIRPILWALRRALRRNP